VGGGATLSDIGYLSSQPGCPAMGVMYVTKCRLIACFSQPAWAPRWPRIVPSEVIWRQKMCPGGANVLPQNGFETLKSSGNHWFSIFYAFAAVGVGRDGSKLGIRSFQEGPRGGQKFPRRPRTLARRPQHSQIVAQPYF